MKCVDIAVFAGQSNMSGRGNVKEAVICDRNAGFEYKAISNPDKLLPIVEPFGLGEDKKGAIYDIDSYGNSKRVGGMVSAVVNEYYKNTGRKIVAVSASIGGSNTDKWKSNYIYDAVARLESAKKFLNVNDIKIKRIFVVWCQGESDGDRKMSEKAYIANTTEIFGMLKAHGVQKCFLVQTGHYNYIDYPDSNNGLTGMEWDGMYEVIRNAQLKLCAENEDFILVGSFEVHIADMKDMYHYNQSAYNAVGKTVGENIVKYYNEECHIR